MSLNFGPLDGGVYKCELNNATEEKQVPSTLREKRNYIYLAIEVNFLRFGLQSDSFWNRTPYGYVHSLLIGWSMFSSHIFATVKEDVSCGNACTAVFLEN